MHDKVMQRPQKLPYNFILIAAAVHKDGGLGGDTSI